MALTTEQWQMLESWAEDLQAQHDAYWNRPFEQIIADKIANADQFGFLPCPRCPYRIGFGPPFDHLLLCLPGWKGEGEPTDPYCPEHETLLLQYRSLPVSHPDFHNLSLWRDRWNEEISKITP